ncbi:MAG: DUF5611 family protein [Thermoplasmata archaeon]|nr:DUF5611 family protein [Thermoplasmata archaeon]MCI4341987.1 DUF5611 family protein [Thermoplasmata archaeon]
MQRYPVRPSHRARLRDGSLSTLATEQFGSARAEGPKVVSSYGAIAELKVWPEGSALAVDLRMDPKVEEAVARETIRRYNLFLLGATGYSAKERAKRLRKAAVADSPGS